MDKFEAEIYNSWPTNELITAALSTEDNKSYRNMVGVLKYRATGEVFNAAQILTRSDDPHERLLGVHIFSEFGIPTRCFQDAVIDVLVGHLECETDEDVIESLCIAFGHNSGAGVVEPLVKFKGHPNADIRQAVVFGLLTQKTDLAIRMLIELTNDPDDEVRNWAAFGLGMQLDLNTVEIKEALIHCLDDGSDAVRGEALRGLARRGDPRVIEALIRELAIMEQSDGWYDYAFEAAESMPDARLNDSLVSAKHCGIKDKTLDHAIALCRLPGSGEGNDFPSNSKTSCPVCGHKRAFKKSDKWQFCKRCGWSDDPDQRNNPDSRDGYNHRSLNEERERWFVRVESVR